MKSDARGLAFSGAGDWDWEPACLPQTGAGSGQGGAEEEGEKAGPRCLFRVFVIAPARCVSAHAGFSPAVTTLRRCCRAPSLWPARAWRAVPSPQSSLACGGLWCVWGGCGESRESSLACGGVGAQALVRTPSPQDAATRPASTGLGGTASSISTPATLPSPSTLWSPSVSRCQSTSRGCAPLSPHRAVLCRTGTDARGLCGVQAVHRHAADYCRAAATERGGVQHRGVCGAGGVRAGAALGDEEGGV